MTERGSKIEEAARLAEMVLGNCDRADTDAPEGPRIEIGEEENANRRMLNLGPGFHAPSHPGASVSDEALRTATLTADEISGIT